jgi:hypothetical protein
VGGFADESGATRGGNALDSFLSATFCSIKHGGIEYIDIDLVLGATMVTVDVFGQRFKGDVVEPTSVDYPAAISRWAVNAERKAR